MMVALWALLVALCVLVMHPAASAGGASPAGLHGVIYAVEVNGVRVSDGALLLAAGVGDVYARPDDLRAWRLVVPPGALRIVRDANAYVALRALAGVRVAFDAPTQTLKLTAGPTALRTTDLQLSTGHAFAATRPAGAFADYAFAATGGAGVSGFAAQLDTGVAALGGVIRNGFGWTPGYVSRLQTAWQRDDVERMQTLVIGDATTQDRKTSAALRFAGISWASDFDEQPLFSTFPGFDIRGAATVPSALDIYVNGILAERRDVPAGAYALRDLPLFDGAGTVDVRGTDALGGISTVELPYYVSRDLLKPGLAAFSYSAGFLDEDGDTGPFIIDAARRFGVTDRLTAGASLQHGGDRTIAGGEADWLAGHSGVISLAAAASRGKQTMGTLWDAGYDYGGRRLTVGAELKVASAGFASLDPTALAIGREVNLHAALRVTRSTLAQLSLVRDATIAGPVSLWTFGVAGSGKGIPYSVTAYRSAGAAAGAFGLTCVWSVPIGQHSTLSPHIGTGTDSAQSQLEYTGSRSSNDANVAWDVAAGMTRGATSAAHITAADRLGEFDFDATESPGFSIATARASGGIALLGGKLAATREITGSFALVRVPGFAGVDVYVNARYAGSTDAHGDLLTADLIPFVENEIRIDPARLGLNTTVDALTRTVVPTASSGTTIIFAARLRTDVRLTLRAKDGRPLAPGTIVHAADGADGWPVGLEGHVDLLGLAPGDHTLEAGDGPAACHFRLSVPALGRPSTLPDAICK